MSVCINKRPVVNLRKETRVLARQLILNEYAENETIHSKTLRKGVLLLINKHPIIFEEMISGLEINENNICYMFASIVNELFTDSIVNWGRIIAVFALAYQMAKQLTEKAYNVDTDIKRHHIEFAEFVGVYIVDHFYSWLLKHNGWDGIILLFEETRKVERQIAIYTILLAICTVFLFILK